jgi:hypothetical protein
MTNVHMLKREGECNFHTCMYYTGECASRESIACLLGTESNTKQPAQQTKKRQVHQHFRTSSVKTSMTASTSTKQW